MSQPLLDRHISGAVKGTALILMFIHHLFTFPQWYVDGVYNPHIELFAEIFSSPTKICVPVFAFLTGYFYAVRGNHSPRYPIRKATDLVISYWIYFIPVLILALGLGVYTFRFKTFLLEALALRRDIMIFAWYVPFYCIVMFLLPVMTRILTKSLFLDVGIVLFLQVLLSIASKLVPGFYVQDVLACLSSWFPSVMMGYLSSKYHIFDDLDRLCVNNSPKAAQFIIYCAMICIPFLLRAGDLVLSFGSLFRDSVSNIVNELVLFLFIYGLSHILFFFKNSVAIHILEKIGLMSMQMWFLHCVFFNICKEYTQKILYAPRFPVLVLIWACILCYTTAKLLEPVRLALVKRKNSLLFDNRN